MEEQNITRFFPSPQEGLTKAQAEERVRDGLSNQDAGVHSKSIGEIFRDHFFTFFNLLNFAIALCILITGSYRNMFFLGVVISNLAIGVFQEVRAKRIIDKLSLLASPKAHVIREGEEHTLDVSELVLDDILLLRAGEQICADAIVVEGDCEANESLLTGESDAVEKSVGDLLYSGSFIASGSCRARVEHIGGENYANRIANDSKYIKQANSEIMISVRRLIAFFGGCVIPIGVLLFCNEFFVSGLPWREALILSAASMIGMIPEGLVLLISAVLAVSVMRLAKYKTLVHDLYCIETLARVDVLCVDKTGTITEGSLKLEELIPACESSEQATCRAIGILMANLSDENPTAKALRAVYPGAPCETDVRLPFSSARKWSGVHIPDDGAYVLGAAEILVQEPSLLNAVQEYVKDGKRVLAIAYSKSSFEEHGLPQDLHCLGLIVMSDVIRHGAEETFAYFKKQGVAVKVISGDNPVAVAQIAKRAGLEGADACVDARTLDTEEKLTEAAERYTVFGRVTPQQKLELVKALKKKDHTVAMTGDGVNDVLALKEADCSIAMAAGSDAARTVSNLVLLDSDFSSMPVVVREGRRSINNLQRSASLFIVKNIFTMLIAVISLILPFSYPFQPIQFTLISTFTIGIPSFLLAMETNNEPLKGSFYATVLSAALPASLCVAGNVVWIALLAGRFGVQGDALSTVCVLITAFTQFLMLLKVCLPFTKLRLALCIVMVCGFGTGVIFLRDLLCLTGITGNMVGILAAAASLTCVLFPLLVYVSARYLKPWIRRQAKEKILEK